MTKTAKIINRLMGLAVIAIMLVGMILMPGKALALESMDKDALVTLTVGLSGTEEPVPGMEFKAYKVADMDENAAFTVDPAFAGYSIDFSGIQNQEDWRTLSQTLQNYIARDGVAPSYTAVTNDNTQAEFGFVEKGLYLILADSYEYNYNTYTITATMVAVPNIDTTTDSWVYDVAVSAKYTSEEVPPIVPGTSGLEVIKLWKNEDGVTRPETIIAQLICDGNVVEEVELNKENGWKHTWTGLEAGKTYAVTEKAVPDGYTVAITYENSIYTITNTGNPPGTPPTTPPSNPPKLPQTGVPWVPVIAFGGSGVVLLGAGLIRRKDDK